LGNLHDAGAVQEVGEENGMSGGKQIPDEWVDDEYVYSPANVTPAGYGRSVEYTRIRERELAEIRRAETDTL
jgi:hypothetical protein